MFRHHLSKSLFLQYKTLLLAIIFFLKGGGLIYAQEKMVCDPSANQSDGKIVDIYFIEGSVDRAISEITHVNDVGVIAKTEGYQEGDCLDIVIKAEDGGEIIKGSKALTLWGKVNKEGIVKLENIFKDYSIILMNDSSNKNLSKTKFKKTTTNKNSKPNKKSTPPNHTKDKAS